VIGGSTPCSSYPTGASPTGGNYYSEKQSGGKHIRFTSNEPMLRVVIAYYC